MTCLISMAFAIVTSLYAEEGQFVRVTEPFANVYEFLDPQSKIIMQAKKGDHFELVYSGTSWFQVKVKNKVGWIERRAGEVVSDQSGFPVLSITLLLIMIAGTFGGVFVFIQRQKTAEF
ncbi:MAG: hypothetical protein GF401_06460 [Chitinivibrionales bacterium]|nr:hypothetical protein [Chitinivibrionales bacterium]